MRGAWLRGVHIPKTGGTTLDVALLRVRCFLAGDGAAEAACLAACEEGSKARAVPPCKTTGNVHRPALDQCHGAYGFARALRGAAGDYVDGPGACGASDTAFSGPSCALCGTMLRDPWARAVSGWFFKGHNPWWDRYGVGWPPVDGFVDGAAAAPRSRRRRLLPASDVHAWTDRKTGEAKTATFGDYARTRAYANVAVRMLGDHAQAYRGAVVPDPASLARALAVLDKLPFAIFEALDASFLLLAHAFSTSNASCAALADRLRPLARTGVRHTGRVTLLRREALANNASLRAAFERHNALDRALYDGATNLWCAEWRRATADPDSCVTGAPPPSLCGGR